MLTEEGARSVLAGVRYPGMNADIVALGLVRSVIVRDDRVHVSLAPVRQFSRGVHWPDIDVLVVDLPPGTGDVPLSLAQSIGVDGAVVVTTPQRLAVLEATKAVEMFRKLGVPVLGVVENMSHAECSCGRRSYPFGRGGGATLGRETGCPLVGCVPFEDEVMTGGDCGSPTVSDRPDGRSADVFRDVAAHVKTVLGLVPGSPAATVAAR